MILHAIQVELPEILGFRALHLQETNCQIRYNARHERGWTDSYRLEVDGHAVGYGAIAGQEIEDRDTVFEFFVIPPFRKFSRLLFRELIKTSQAKYIECQSNDAQLSGKLFEFASNIKSDVILFEDCTVTEHKIDGAIVRRRLESDSIFVHKVEPVGDYVMAIAGEVMATGGFMLHYNPPFADLYMEVREDCRRRGFGSFLIQEVKRECYLAGRMPAARTSLDNMASRRTLCRAGLRECGFMLLGEIRIGSA